MTQDPAINALIATLKKIPADQHCLWFADENSLAALPHLVQSHPQLSLCTNRYDIHQRALALGIKSTFNDAELNPKQTPPTAQQHVLARVSKEKPLTHHVINQAASKFGAMAHLHLAGLKGEGIKTTIKKAASLFAKNTGSLKNGDAYSGSFSEPLNSPALLETQDYTGVRQIGDFEGFRLFSKPGVFGFEKIDDGSVLLLDSAHQYLQSQHITPEAILDLGCGYGLLTLGCQNWGARYFAATDNNAAALIAMQANADANDCTVDIIPADAGADIDHYFDCVVCNPPFHQGFSVSGDLTDKFLQNASHKLTSSGYAFFVVNSFIAIEKKAARYFQQQKTLVNNKRFKVVLLHKPLKR
ncbi:MAG TPA: methyltransferase [Marinagarivorans sp.]